MSRRTIPQLSESREFKINRLTDPDHIKQQLSEMVRKKLQQIEIPSWDEPTESETTLSEADEDVSSLHSDFSFSEATIVSPSRSEEPLSPRRNYSEPGAHLPRREGIVRYYGNRSTDRK